VIGIEERCFCGKTNGFRPYFKLRMNSLKTIRCCNCGLVVVNNTPIYANNLADFYSLDAFAGKRDLQDTDLYTNYYFNCYKGYDLEDFTIVQFRRILSDIQRISAAPTNPIELLDIGCATGVFLDLARNYGYLVRGVEINKELAQYARDIFGLEVETDFIKAAFPSNEFYIITLLDVIEHFPTTIFDNMIKEIYRVLKPGGLLVIRTPSGDGFLRECAKALYFGSFKTIEFPMHLFYSYEHIINFSPLSLKMILKRYGFHFVSQRFEEENQGRLNINRIVKVILRLSYIFSALLRREHKMIQFFIKRST
jgi:SAM-dependent methyltransferase